VLAKYFKEDINMLEAEAKVALRQLPTKLYSIPRDVQLEVAPGTDIRLPATPQLQVDLPDLEPPLQILKAKIAQVTLIPPDTPTPVLYVATPYYRAITPDYIAYQEDYSNYDQITVFGLKTLLNWIVNRAIGSSYSIQLTPRQDEYRMVLMAELYQYETLVVMDTTLASVLEQGIKTFELYPDSVLLLDVETLARTERWSDHWLNSVYTYVLIDPKFQPVYEEGQIWISLAEVETLDPELEYLKISKSVYLQLAEFHRQAAIVLDPITDARLIDQWKLRFLDVDRTLYAPGWKLPRLQGNLLELVQRLTYQEVVDVRLCYPSSPIQRRNLALELNRAGYSFYFDGVQVVLRVDNWETLYLGVELIERGMSRVSQSTVEIPVLRNLESIQSVIQEYHLDVNPCVAYLTGDPHFPMRLSCPAGSASNLQVIGDRLMITGT